MKHTHLAVLAAVSAMLGWTTHSQAATIVWNSATNIAATTDVSTTGTLLYAARYYSGAGVSKTINGVTFNDPGTNVSWGGPTQNLGSNTNGIPAGDYSDFLKGNSYAGSGNANTGTLTLNGLTPTQQYMVQIWSNDGRSGSLNQLVTFTAGNAVSLNRNTTGGGGLGQWVIGTFTADASTQAITVSNSLSQGLALNGLQVRTTIPEPSAALLGSLGMFALLRRRR